MIHAYARVSTTDQTTRMQLDAIARVRPDHVWDECGSGADAGRPYLAAMLEALRPGDEVVVWKLDRLARSLRHLLVIIDTVTSAGASLRSLTEPIDTASALGRMMLQLLGSFSEFERGIIIERAAAGRVAARDRGVVFGRKRTVDRDMVQLCLDEGLTQSETARRMGCTRASICRLLREGIVFQASPPRPPSGKQAAPRCQPSV